MNLTANLLKANLAIIQKRIYIACEKSGRSPDDVKLVAVTKTIPTMGIRHAFVCGIHDFGENRLQEAQSKIDELADLRDQITWHMVGHVQSNKAKLTSMLFDIIHSIDSVKIARLISRNSIEPSAILIQVNISEEETKNGFEMNDVASAIKEIRKLPNLTIKGLMAIAPMVDDPEDTRLFFRKLRTIRDDFGLEQLSMGMSDDLEIAIEEGATMIRIGRALFGGRSR